MVYDHYIFDGSSSSSSSSSLLINNELNPITLLDHFTPNFMISSSPPSNLLETLKISQKPQNFPQIFSEESSLDFPQFRLFDNVEKEVTSIARNQNNIENPDKFMQRSFSNSELQFEIPMINSLNFHYNSPENDFFFRQLRRVYSAGDLQKVENRSSEKSPEKQFSDKVERYSAEERKEKILKYRAKRNQRNFTKTIKYACRKTLADSRPRIRGRFAKNDEIAEIDVANITSFFSIDDNNSNLWKLDGMHEEKEALVSSFVQYSSLW